MNNMSFYTDYVHVYVYTNDKFRVSILLRREAASLGKRYPTFPASRWYHLQDRNILHASSKILTPVTQ
jgi:hypothetical protein